MKNILFLLFLVGICFGLELSDEQKQYLKEKKTITFCVDPDWEPFEIINSEGKHEGIGADIIRLIGQRVGVKIELVKTKTWDETLEFSKAKKCDILSFLNETPQRNEWLTFTKPIFSDPNVLVGRIDSKYIEDISKEKLSIALPRGTAMSERFAKDFPNLTIIPTQTEGEAFRLVEDRKADITLRSLIVTAYTIKKEGLFNLKIIGEPKGYENNLAIGVLQDRAIIRDILNLGIATLTKKDIDAIVNNHVTIVVEKVTIIDIAVWIFGVVLIILVVIFLWNHILRKKVAHEVAKNLQQKEQLIQKQKQAEMGNIIANISHQWRDALSNISSYNLETLVKLDFDYEITKEEQQKNAKNIEKSIDFMSDTMKRFLEFYKQSDTITAFDGKSLLEETMMIIDMKLKLHKMEVTIKEDVPFDLVGIKNEWMNVWLNLIINSMNAAIKKEIKNPKIEVVFSSDKVIFRDNCGGIDASMLQKIERGENSGLGIAMSKEILKKYNFSLLIENIENGVEFRVESIL